MSKKLVFAFMILVATALAGCNASTSSTPPNAVTNGQITSDSYAGGGALCNGGAEGNPAPNLVINGTSGTYSQTQSGCTQGGAFTLAYGSGNNFQLTQTSQTCGSGCSTTGNNACTPNSTSQTPMIGTFTSSGSTLILTFTNSGCSSTNGHTGTDTEVDTFTAQ